MWQTESSHLLVFGNQYLKSKGILFTLEQCDCINCRGSRVYYQTLNAQAYLDWLQTNNTFPPSAMAGIGLLQQQINVGTFTPPALPDFFVLYTSSSGSQSKLNVGFALSLEHGWIVSICLLLQELGKLPSSGLSAQDFHFILSGIIPGNLLHAYSLLEKNEYFIELNEKFNQ